MPKEWDIPSELQPDPADYSFDLDEVLSAVVGLRTTAPADAFTASALGTEREGSGVVISDDGLLLTMGYLITEAETVWITSADGRAIPGHALAFDGETGFGLVQPLGKLNLPKLEFGESGSVKLGDQVLFASAGGRRRAIETKVVGRQEFAGYWEYLLDEAIFTAPAHPFWGGGALLGKDGKLLGVGSLILQQGDGKGAAARHEHGSCRSISCGRSSTICAGSGRSTARHGRGSASTRWRMTRPWSLAALADGGPADRAGLRTGDHVISVQDEEITDLAGLWRGVWACGPAGSRVTLMVRRDERQLPVSIATVDRRTLLKSPRMH